MTMPRQQHTICLLLLLLFTILLTACAAAEASEEEIEAQWQASAHADSESRSFNNWDEAGQIDPLCAKCHSTHGYRDFLGLDGATAGEVDDVVPTGTTIECEACHNDATIEKDSAIIPSGLELTGLGGTASCAECHQGRASGVQIAEATDGQGADTVNQALSFPNIHNNAAAPTQYGTLAMGGYEYDGRSYLARYGHVVEFDTCITCHDAHSLDVDAEKCSACHLGVRSTADLIHIRTGNIDYDGDGDIEEGLAFEIETMHERLLTAIRLHALRTEGADQITYEADRRPHFFDETGEPYTTWTPRLLQAAYNYHYIAKGSGDYAHHGLYTIQLLYDSLDDLGLSQAGMSRPEADP